MENRIKFYNTLTRSVETFVPNEDGKVKMYTCGPTVYHFAHIGNLRSYIMEDVLEKTLRYAGYDVKRVMNITDVGHLSSDADTGEDKMLKGAKREHKTVMEIAKFYTDAFFSDCEKLNIKRPDVVEPATNCISEFIHMIEVLLEKGYAYIAGDNVYFDTSKLDDYYVFSSQSEKELMVGVRDDVDEDTNKKNKSDFVLWFTKSKFDNQELKWDSPWGIGYPGWHIECSTMSLKYLGKTFDFHGGGSDLIFPHHENEIAQSQAYCGDDNSFARYWLHNGFITINQEKMSKSLGNFFTVKEILDKYPAEVLRFFIVSTHYRSPLDFSDARLDEAASSLTRLKNALDNLKELTKMPSADDKSGSTLSVKADEAKKGFYEAMDDDFNTALAIADMFDLAKEINIYYNEVTSGKTACNKNAVDKALSVFNEMADIIGILGEDDTKTDDGLVDSLMNLIISIRQDARKNKDWATADKIRDELKAIGIALEDSPTGVRWKK